MDSKLVVEQMCGRWQIKHPGLRPLAAEAAAAGRPVHGRPVRAGSPGTATPHADALANAAMDAAAAAGTTTPAVEPPRVVEPPRTLSGPQQAGGGAATTAARAEAPGADLTTAPASWEPRPSFTATRLILVRHGETEYTEQGRYSGRGDVALSPTGPGPGAGHRRPGGRARPGRRGRDQLTAVAGVRPPRRRSPPRIGKVPVRRDDDLIECDFGAWEGRTFAEVREQWAGELDAWLASTRVAPPDGESFAEVAERCAPGDRTAAVRRTPVRPSWWSPTSRRSS